MSYSEAMAKHYQDKRASKTVSYQPKYSNTCTLADGNLAEGNISKGATIYSNGKLNAAIVARVKEIGNNGNYFIDSPIYSDEFMKERNKEIASAETVDELVAYLDDLDESIKVIRADDYVEKGLGLEQQVASDGIHLKTYLYI